MADAVAGLDRPPPELCGHAGRAVLNVLDRAERGLTIADLCTRAYVSRERVRAILAAGTAGGWIEPCPPERAVQVGRPPMLWRRTGKPLPPLPERRR